MYKHIQALLESIDPIPANKPSMITRNY